MLLLPDAESCSLPPGSCSPLMLEEYLASQQEVLGWSWCPFGFRKQPSLSALPSGASCHQGAPWPSKGSCFPSWSSPCAPSGMCQFFSLPQVSIPAGDPPIRSGWSSLALPGFGSSPVSLPTTKRLLSVRPHGRGGEKDPLVGPHLLLLPDGLIPAAGDGGAVVAS